MSETTREATTAATTQARPACCRTGSTPTRPR